MTNISYESATRDTSGSATQDPRAGAGSPTLRLTTLRSGPAPKSVTHGYVAPPAPTSTFPHGTPGSNKSEPVTQSAGYVHGDEHHQPEKYQGDTCKGNPVGQEPDPGEGQSARRRRHR